MALNRSPEFCLKLTYRYLLNADVVPGDTLGWIILAPGVYYEQTWQRSTRILHTKYQDFRPYCFRQEYLFMFSLYKPM